MGRVSKLLSLTVTLFSFVYTIQFLSINLAMKFLLIFAIIAILSAAGTATFGKDSERREADEYLADGRELKRAESCLYTADCDSAIETYKKEHGKSSPEDLKVSAHCVNNECVLSSNA